MVCIVLRTSLWLSPAGIYFEKWNIKELKCSIGVLSVINVDMISDMQSLFSIFCKPYETYPVGGGKICEYKVLFTLRKYSCMRRTGINNN